MTNTDHVLVAVKRSPSRWVAVDPLWSARRSWMSRRLLSRVPLISALAVVGAAMAWNLQGYPGRANDDEGTYVNRAWAMLNTHHLSNYTYFWDHPFLGWATIAAWAGMSDGFSRDSRAVMVGRELMWIVTLVSCILLYVLARRIGIRSAFAVAAVIMFGLSPVDIWYHRMVSLDNLATVWVLAALVLAASRRRSWAAAVGSGACFAVAFWSKETILLLLPPVLWLLWQNTGKSTRIANISSFSVVCFSGIAFYPLMAILKGELLPGPGHVSLWGEEIVYQLFSRQSTGSLLNTHSGTYQQFHTWLTLDPWVILGGTATIITGLLIRRLRPFALAMLLQIAAMVKGGYVPYAFVTAMLPFAALLIAGTADTCWQPVNQTRWQHRKGMIRLPQVAMSQVGKAPVAAVAALFVLVIGPHWLGSLQKQSGYNGFATENAAVNWVSEHVPTGEIVVCDAYPWLDIKLRTHATPVYLWQIDSDPQVMRTELPRGYKSISYMVLEPSSPLAFAALPGRPTLQQAISHSAVVKRFGTIVIYKVRKLYRLSQKSQPLDWTRGQFPYQDGPNETRGINVALLERHMTSVKPEELPEAWRSAALTVVLPTYNEAANLPMIVAALLDLPLTGLQILIADDNSPDGTGDIADDLAARCGKGRMSVVHRPGKEGLGRAYVDGVTRAVRTGAEFVAQMDSDLSHGPEYLPQMLGVLLSTGADVVIGSRYTVGASVAREWSWHRKALSGFANTYVRVLLRLGIRDVTAGFKLWRSSALEAVDVSSIRSNGYSFQVEMNYRAVKRDLKIVEIPIHFAERVEGESKMTLRVQLESALMPFLLRYRARRRR